MIPINYVVFFTRLFLLYVVYLYEPQIFQKSVVKHRTTAMKQFIISDLLQLQQWRMLFAAMWPLENSGKSYQIKFLVIFISTSILTVLSFIRSCQDFKRGNIDNACFAACIVIAAGHAAFKVAYLQYKKPSFYKILETFSHFSLINHEDEVNIHLKFRMKWVRRVSKFLLCSCLLAVSGILGTEFISEYRTNPRPLPYGINMENAWTFTFYWLFLLVSLLYTGWIIGTYEGFIFTILSLSCAQLDILRKEISIAINLYPPELLGTQDSKFYEQLTNKLLKKCVIKHNAIERVIQAIETKFTFGFLIQLLLTLAVTGLIGISFIFVSIDTLDFYKCAFFFIADLTQVGLVCTPCDIVIRQVLKMSMSYFAVLKSVYVDE